MEAIAFAMYVGVLVGQGSVACENEPAFEDYALGSVARVESVALSQNVDIDQALAAYDAAFGFGQNSQTTNPLSCKEFAEISNNL